MFDVSERFACRVIEAHRSSVRHRPSTVDEALLVQRITELSRQHPRYGYRRIHALLKAEGWAIGRDRVMRLRRREGLQVVQRRRRPRAVRGSSAHACHVMPSCGLNDVWTYDFLHLRLLNGGKLRVLSVLDEYSRECLVLQAGYRQTACQVVESMAPLLAERGAPRALRSDNGTEMRSKEVQRLLASRGVVSALVAPASPWENGIVESFHSRMRDELLNREVFVSLYEVQLHLDWWRREYNEVRPHSALGYRSPLEFAQLSFAQPPASL